MAMQRTLATLSQRDFGTPPAKAKAGSPIARPAAAAVTDPTYMFHQHWWLAAVTQGQYGEVSVSSNDRVIGRLPYVTRKRMGFTLLGMPPFTHILGPTVDAGGGKPQTQLLRRMSIIRDLIDQLPPHDSFNQSLGDANIDALAFQACGFQIRPQYTFEIDCRANPPDIWNAMHSKTRQHIRRAEEKLSVVSVEDPDEFVRFYRDNLREQKRSSFLPLDVFPSLFAESRIRGCGEVLSANWPNGKSAAMTFLVWDHSKMFYLLSTRARDEGDNGSVNLLLWAAINRAHARGLVFDLDGVSTSGTVRFLSGFGGQPKIRMLVQRSRSRYNMFDYFVKQLKRNNADDSSFFT